MVMVLQIAMVGLNQGPRTPKPHVPGGPKSSHDEGGPEGWPRKRVSDPMAAAREAKVFREEKDALQDLDRQPFYESRRAPDPFPQDPLCAGGSSLGCCIIAVSVLPLAFSLLELLWIWWMPRLFVPALPSRASYMDWRQCHIVEVW